MHSYLTENAHLWALFVAGHGLHVVKRASLSAKSPLSGIDTRTGWLRAHALNLVIRFFVNAAAFSYWIAHPAMATHVIGSVGLPARPHARAGSRLRRDVRADRG